MIDAYSLTIVPKQFLEVSYKLYPILKKDVSLRKLYCHIVNQMVTNKKGFAILHAKLLSKLEGKESQHASKNYVASKLLSKFEEHVTKIRYTTNFFGDVYNYSKGEARRGVIDIPPQLITLFKDRSDERVYIESNRKFSKKSSTAKQKIKKAQKALVEEYTPLNEPQRQLLTYLNNQPSNRYKKCLDYLEEAKAKAEELVSPVGKERARKLLEQIETVPQPFYKPSTSGHTQRIFGNSFLQLNKEIRSIICKDWIEIDIDQAQLRILSRIWNIPEVANYLDSQRNLWEDLIQYIQGLYNFEFGPLDKGDLKGILKRFIYSCCFGMTLTNLKATFKEECEEYLGTDYQINLTKKNKNAKDVRLSLGEYLLCHPLIRPLIKARTKVMRKIKREGGANSPYGWIKLDRGVISVMANVAQNVEQMLMTPIINASIASETEAGRGTKTTECQIMGYLHDGAYLKIRRQSEWKRWVKHMYKAWIKLCSKLEMNLDISISINDIKYKFRVDKITKNNPLSIPLVIAS